MVGSGGGPSIGGGSGNNGGTIPGGSSGSQGNNYSYLSVDAKKIIKNVNNLTIEQVQALNAAVATLLLNPYYQAIFNWMVQNGYTLDAVNINPNLGNTTGQFNSTTNEFTFRDAAAIEGSFSEEFLHKMQKLLYGALYDSCPEVNIEFEAKLIQDCMNAMYPEIDKRIKGATDHNIDIYQRWVIGVLNNSGGFPTTSQIMTPTNTSRGTYSYGQALDNFGKNSAYAGPYESSHNPTAFDHIHSMLK